MPSIHRQLRNWCLRRRYDACEAFATALDDEMRDATKLTPDVLLAACRRIRHTRFFRENSLDPEVVAQELSAYLKMPRVRARIKKVTPEHPDTPRDIANPSEQPPDIFLSYYHVDRSFVDRLARSLAREGFTVWYDDRGLTAGESFPREIERAVGSARRIGVVCTPDSLERPWVQKEMEVGHYREGRGEVDVLIPIRLQPTELPHLLAPKQWCDFVSDFEVGMSELVESLTSGGRSARDP